jgi:hypothetical protein
MPAAPKNIQNWIFASNGLYSSVSVSSGSRK